MVFSVVLFFKMFFVLLISLTEEVVKIQVISNLYFSTLCNICCSCIAKKSSSDFILFLVGPLVLFMEAETSHFKCFMLQCLT